MPLYVSSAHFAQACDSGLVDRAVAPKGGPRRNLVATLFTVLNGMVVNVSTGVRHCIYVSLDTCASFTTFFRSSNQEAHASIVQMRAFAQLHRLLLALVAAHPELLAEAQARVERFIGNDPSARTKKKVRKDTETRATRPHANEFTSQLFLLAYSSRSQIWAS